MITTPEHWADLRRRADESRGVGVALAASEVGMLLADLREMAQLYCMALAVIDRPGEVFAPEPAKVRAVAVRKFGEAVAVELFGEAP